MATNCVTSGLLLPGGHASAAVEGSRSWTGTNRATRWLVAVAHRDSAYSAVCRSTGVATTVVAARPCRGDTSLLVGWLPPRPRPRPGRAAPTPTRILDVSRSPTWLAGPPCSDLASRSRRVRRDRPATPRAEYPSPPTARPERGVPAHAGARDRPVAAPGPRAATVLPVGGPAAFRVAKR